MNVRALVAFGCVLLALGAIAEPAYAVRLAAIGLALVVAGVLLDALREALGPVTPLRPAPAGVPPARASRTVPGELAELRREVSWAAPEAPIPDVVFAQLQAMARRRVRARLRLEPARPADHAALARTLPPALFTVVMSGLVMPPDPENPDARCVSGYVPYTLRPPMWALPSLLAELEQL